MYSCELVNRVLEFLPDFMCQFRNREKVADTEAERHLIRGAWSTRDYE